MTVLPPKSENVIMFEDILDESLDDVRYDLYGSHNPDGFNFPYSGLDFEDTGKLVLHIYFDLENPPKMPIFNLFFNYKKDLSHIVTKAELRAINKLYYHEISTRTDFIQRIYRLTSYKLSHINSNFNHTSMERYLILTFKKNAS